jgi:thiol:disulfide interchange protein DsbD
MKALLGALALGLALVSAPAAAQAPAAAVPAARVVTPQVTAELIAESAGIQPGGTVHVALRQTIKPGWHTYWRNPGDSGEATRISWTLPAGWSTGEIVWPAPERQPIGPLVNYGYSREVLLPVPVTAPPDARPGDVVRLRVDAFWLVCEEVCIPESGALLLELPVTAGAPGPNPRGGRQVARTVAAAPRPAALDAGVRLEAGGLKLAVAGPALRATPAAGAYFFPFEGTVIDHAKPQAVERGPEGLTLTLTPGYGLQAGGGLAGPVEGVLAVDGQAYQISAKPGASPAGAAGLGPPQQRAEGGGLSLPLAAALALLGGLLLNLMPCVFPVLGVKAAALAEHAHEPRAARLQGLAFGTGVLATFLLLAAVLLAARAAGEAAGWGFQLQSPPVVAALAVLTLVVGLNLSGVFHMGLSVQNLGGGLATRGGAAGAFFTGALAVVVAAPCTAPFMAGAIGWALVQPPLTALAVFTALAVGFAAPFVALSVSPGVLKRLPRPGPWMETLRNLLAFPMYAASAWLVWIFARQAGIAGLGELAVVIWLAALAAWLWGRSQSATRVAPFRIAAVLAGAAVLGWFGLAGLSSADGDPPTASAGAASAEAWSPERVAALRGEGRPVFVNFTADWCVTCKVNERVALSDRRVAEAFERSGVVYLKADWTARDAVIAEALTRHGRSGVPLYLLYGAGGGEPQVLPQLLTPGAVVRALEQAGEKA